jgi:hypothetical protein
MAYYWKYTRNGRYNPNYISFVVDVLPRNITINNGKIFWLTSFEELCDFLVLLQDVEVINNPDVGITKPAYSSHVKSLGYTPQSTYKISGSSLPLGVSINGPNPGSPLPWGYIDNPTTPITIDVTGMKIQGFVNASNGLMPPFRDDKLSPYRNHTLFVASGKYWDLMPLHSCIILIVGALMQCDRQRTISLIHSVLIWI